MHQLYGFDGIFLFALFHLSTCSTELMSSFPFRICFVVDETEDGDSTSATHAHGESHEELVEAERAVVLLVEYSEEIVDHYRRLTSGAGMAEVISRIGVIQILIESSSSKKIVLIVAMSRWEELGK